MLTNLIRVGLLVLAAATAESLRRQIARRSDTSSGAPPRDEATWEGEGGALPDTGSHIGPKPDLP